LVLGLLIASAKSSYDTQSSQVQHLTADVVLLDQLLAQYGPEARPIRELMRQALGPLVERVWQETSAAAKNEPFAAIAASEAAFAKIGELAPQTDAQRSLKDRAVQVSTDIARTRLALFVQAGSVPFPCCFWPSWYSGSPSFSLASACSSASTPRS
jgi:hypothetical protein